MKTYSLEVTIKLTDKATTYPAVSPVDLSFKENLPANENASRYIRKRIAEELNRTFAATPVIENCDVNVEEDPLQ
jgi:hypothetical protein